MTNQKRILIGGLGAMTPILMNLLVVDLSVTFQSISVFIIVGYLLRVTILFYLGGLIAYLHKDEKSPFKLFELGIVAPALVTGFMNAANVDSHAVGQNVNSAIEKTGQILFLPEPAYAGPQTQETIKSFPKGPEPISSQFWRGFIGKKNDHTYFVIAEDGLTLAEARQRVKTTRSGKNGSDSWVYKSATSDAKYAVVIAERVTRQEAEKILKRAKQKGMKKPVLWRYESKDSHAIAAKAKKSDKN